MEREVSLMRSGNPYGIFVILAKRVAAMPQFVVDKGAGASDHASSAGVSRKSREM